MGIKVPASIILGSFYFILFYFILFYFILFYFILFYFILAAYGMVWYGMVILGKSCLGQLFFPFLSFSCLWMVRLSSTLMALWAVLASLRQLVAA